MAHLFLTELRVVQLTHALSQTILQFQLNFYHLIMTLCLDLIQLCLTADDRGAALPPEQDVMSVNDDDAVSVAASGTHFCEDLPELGSGASGSDSFASQEDTTESVTSAIRTALARLQIGVPQAQPTASSAFFKRSRSETAFMVPPSAEYVQELHACWSDTKALSRLTMDGRVLAAMQEAPKVGLGQMPAVEPGIASLIIPPDEALRPNARCPRPQCRITDDLLCKAYDSGARMGRIGNSIPSYAGPVFLLGICSTGSCHARPGNLDAHCPHWFTLAARSGWRSHRLLSLVGGPSGPCLWFRGNFLVLRHWTPWTVQLRLPGRGDSWQGFTDVIASQSAPGRLRVPHGGPQGLLLLPLSPRGWYQVRDRSRDLLQIGETELETKLGRGPFIPFEPRSLAGVLPGLRRAGGPAGQALSKQRLAHWVVDVISKAYASQDRPLPAGVKCHSTRGMSTSFAAMTGVPLDVICRAASWKSPSTFTRFYRRECRWVAHVEADVLVNQSSASSVKSPPLLTDCIREILVYKDPLSLVVKLGSRPHCRHDALLVPGVVELDDDRSGTCAPRAQAPVCAVYFDTNFTRGAVPQAERSRQTGFEKLDRALTLRAFFQINNLDVIPLAPVLHIIQSLDHGLNFLFGF
ncbi:unnamed protein product, partial [Menidia menidia]